jgi:hypothetical protein
MPISTKLPWKLYPNRVKQDEVRGKDDRVTLKILRRPDAIFGWKLATLEEMYLEDNMP